MDGEPAAKKIKKSYITWNNSERHLLIDKRIEKDNWFSGKNANSNTAWKQIAAILQNHLPPDKDATACKTQWNSIIKKYKSYFKYKSGEGTGEEAVLDEAKDWEFFEKIHSYASKKDNYHPPFLIDSTDGEVSMRSKSQINSFANFDVEVLTSQYSEESSSSSTPARKSHPKERNEFFRLEQHIKKRDKKFEKKLSSLLCVFGQMDQTDYPHIDASGLMLSSDSESN